MKADELVPVYEGPRPHAELIASLLRSDGFHAEVYGGLETSAHPGAVDGARVMVRAQDFASARRVVEEAQ